MYQNFDEQNRLTPDEAQKTLIAGSACAGAMNEAIHKDGPEGAAWGATAGATGIVAVAAAFSAPVALPVIGVAAAIGGVLGWKPWKK